MQAGPKRTPVAPPLTFRELPKARWARCVRFIETYCRVPKGHGALKPVKLRAWQKKIIRGVLDPRVKQSLISMPRGNGKSMLASLLCLYFFFADRTAGARVLCVASSEHQAMLVFDTCRRIVELNPRLAEQVQIFQSKLVLPATDAVLQPLPATSRSLQGYDPSVCIVDELSMVEWGTLESMALALGKRPNSLLLAISTAPLDMESAMHHWREHGLQGDDESFFFAEWSAPPGCAIDDEDAWRTANPAYGDFLDPAAIRSTLRTTREASFRRFRLNQLVTDEDAWLPWGVWEGLSATTTTVPPRSRVVIGFDGSVSGDSTAIVFATVQETPHVVLAGLWEKPDGVKDWKVPRHEVTALVDHLHSTYDVAEMACDPAYWRSEIEAWSLVHPNVVEWPTHTTARQAPATDRVFSLIMEGRLTHDGDERLARHVRNAVVRATPMGDMVGKVNKDSARRVDACVAMIVAVHRAAWYFHQAPKRRRVLAF